MVLEQPEHDAPHDGGEVRERLDRGRRQQALLDGELRESVEDAGQQVEVDLRERQRATVGNYGSRIISYEQENKQKIFQVHDITCRVDARFPLASK